MPIGKIDLVPAKDRHHDMVIRALRKAGWTQISEQVIVVLETRRLWIDLQASKNNGAVAVLIEIKGFEDPPSEVEYLANATGKYALYRAVLNAIGVDLPLYMAVPVQAYRGILSEAIGKVVLQHQQIRLMVYDAETEEILSWID